MASYSAVPKQASVFPADDGHMTEALKRHQAQADLPVLPLS
jgi:hypothetical protein